MKLEPGTYLPEPGSDLVLSHGSNLEVLLTMVTLNYHTSYEVLKVISCIPESSPSSIAMNYLTLV